ncbi:hypothetical protein I3U40_08090 [Mycobacteroides abscessus subsp. abscessus]|uniref:hypothetical protein n=1 Tax=Mycobacteroides abscessus TaxID=36809 RepID=UPI0019D1587F|nr:hypothetical protein [Mycobacteroides abscessus]QSM95692.1 hypothetical protein I3U31_08080 [Mycobacteroides abscessus subsp. abscessus]QSN00725.1 hypothetical protein I3U40_08090 [Mycobacteroides abscessus subsp. abscessus]
MKTLLTASALALGILLAPPAGADPSPWCIWSPELDTSSCDYIVGVPPTGTPVEGPGDWSTPETRTKG